MRRFRAVLAACGLIITCATSLPAHAGYADIVFFGDSLMDTGNLYARSQSILGTPTPTSPPYYDGRFSNGPVWTEYFAKSLGMPTAAAPVASGLAGANNYAVAGSTLGSYVVDGKPLPFGAIPDQLNFYQQNHTVSSDNLYVVMGGGNDIRYALGAYQQGVGQVYSTAYAQALASNPSDPAAAQAAANAEANAAAPAILDYVRGLAAAAADTLAGMVEKLFGMGARHFLIGSIPDLGHTPEATLAGGAALGSDLSHVFNARLNGDLPKLLAQSGIDLDFLDLAALEKQVLANPSAYGFTNTTDACKSGDIGTDGQVCATPDAYYYFDILHPSARGHQLIAAAALQAVPEPTTLALILIALAVLASGVFRRRPANPAPCFG